MNCSAVPLNVMEQLEKLDGLAALFAVTVTVCLAALTVLGAL